MSWLEKLLPPKIQPTDPAERRAVPEGLWIKCPACETVLYKTDLEGNLNVCPKCDHHHRIGARQRLDAFLDPEGRWEIGQEVLPVDALKFKDSKKYPQRLKAALELTGETDALVVLGGAGLVGLAERLQPRIRVPVLDCLRVTLDMAAGARPGTTAMQPAPSLGLSEAFSRFLEG